MRHQCVCGRELRRAGWQISCSPNHGRTYVSRPHPCTQPSLAHPSPTPNPHRTLLRPADDPIRDFYAGLMKEDAKHTSIPTKIAAALTAGTLGVLVGNPTDGGWAGV